MESTPSRLTTSPPGYPWKIFWILLFGSVVGVAGILPLIFSLYRKIISSGPLPMPMPVFIAVQLMESALLFAALITVGLRVARNVGLEMPIMQRWLYGSAAPLPKNAFLAPILAGFALGVLSLLIYYSFFLSRIPDWPVAAEASLPIWKRFLACFYGGINEEVLARLFGFSLVLWFLQKIARQKTSRPTPVIFWVGNAIIAVLFVLAHLPSARIIMPITSQLLIALFSIN